MLLSKAAADLFRVLSLVLCAGSGHGRRYRTPRTRVDFVFVSRFLRVSWRRASCFFLLFDFNFNFDFLSIINMGGLPPVMTSRLAVVWLSSQIRKPLY